jgi:hypothetical protein
MNPLQLHDQANEKHLRLQRELLVPVAQEMYYAAARRGLFFKVWTFVTRRCNQLYALNDIGVQRGAHIGQMTVPIQQIIGSENRVQDFDAHFYPRKAHIEERWVGIAKARLMGTPLPPVELVQVGEDYYVRDGHHRVSVAKALGEVYIEANVVDLKAT